ALKITSTQALTDAVTAALPSSSVDLRDEIPKTERPPSKRSWLFAIGSRPTKGQGTDYGFVSTVDFEARRQGTRDVGYGIRDTWIDPAEVVPALTPTAVEEVNTRELQTHRYHVYAHETHIQTHQTQLQLQSTLIQIQHQVSETRFQIQQTAMAKLRETDHERQ
nr:hypothetical protein [Tanacetum cinerariifolium]